MSGMIIKPFRVWVDGFPEGHLVYARSRQKALAKSWRSFCSYRDDVSFGDFMRMAKAIPDTPDARFGEAFPINGRHALYVSPNNQYVQIAYPGKECILNTHPLDIDQPEARRGTPYYQPDANRAGSGGNPGSGLAMGCKL